MAFLEEGIGYVRAHIRQPGGETLANGWILGHTTASDMPVYIWGFDFQYVLSLAADCLKKYRNKAGTKYVVIRSGDYATISRMHNWFVTGKCNLESAASSEIIRLREEMASMTPCPVSCS